MKKIWIPIVLLLLCCLLTTAGAVTLYLGSGGASSPFVQISEPRDGERIGVANETIIHAIARGDANQKIKRVELWIDNTLQDAQSTNVPGGISPFPIAIHWRPPTPGAHSIVVRAFNAQNARGTASINLDAVTSADRDNDGVPDAIDGCPDQPGLPLNNGCPAPTPGDRDGDGVGDSTNMCPDQPGSPLAEGCPDADSDGVRDSLDACPREFGTAERNGCPNPGDADSDGVPDTSDACPREPGRAETNGCPDSDGDGVRDSDDACPDTPGLPGLRGCPDRDGDGVRDTIDLCPDVAGPASNSGCPPTGTGDSDGDGVDNGTDLSPTEPSSAESGGAPAPGTGTDSDSDGVPDAEEPSEDPLSGLSLFVPAFLYQLVPVELEALEFQVSRDYSQVYCYASAAGQAEERIGPFSSLSGHRWDIAAFLGPLNSRTFLAPMGRPLQVRMECGGIVGGTRESPSGAIGEGGGSEAYFDLGSFSRNHSLTTSMIDEVTVDSSGGSGGHSFRVKYRVCSPGCKTSVLRAPLISLSHGGGQNRMVWAWAGHAYDISGFKVYMNGNYMFAVSPHSTNYLFHDVPPCGRRFDIQLTAYQGNPNRPTQESTRSNIATWDGGICPRTATVSFERFETGDLRFAFPEITLIDVGPIYGTLWAGDERHDFDGWDRVRPNHSYPISDFTPRTEFTVDLASEDSLYLAATVKDRDPGRDDTLFDFESILPPAEIYTRDYTLTGRGGRIVIHITVAPRP